ncbi:MSMEG_0570 family nitrogen starvation response protein [Synechocystis sp. LKSZ1]|uniref:MSMEG_0570 family nitrogen starvation response protein n=1 Tax=Synechocystis sp. LKSZ1 TaxID=3144951 RepID=UPI00336BBDC0
MPEIRFQIQWPDGTQEICYSPSLVVKDYFTPNQSYSLDEFVTRSRIALMIASDRVKAKYGMPCSLALNQLDKINHQAQQYQGESLSLEVKVIHFIEF